MRHVLYYMKFTWIFRWAYSIRCFVILFPTQDDDNRMFSHCIYILSVPLRLRGNLASSEGVCTSSTHRFLASNHQCFMYFLDCERAGTKTHLLWHEYREHVDPVLGVCCGTFEASYAIFLVPCLRVGEIFSGLKFYGTWNASHNICCFPLHAARFILTVWSMTKSGRIGNPQRKSQRARWARNNK